jgi:predicted kinase
MNLKRYHHMTNKEYKPSDFYFSTPMKVEGEDGYEMTVVAVISKGQWDAFHSLDRNSTEAYAINNILRDILGEAQEGIFEASSSSDGRFISEELKRRGLVYNPKIDSRLKEWAEDSQRGVTYQYDDSDKTKKPRVYMMVGLPASGKSTHSKWFEGMHAKFVSRDLCKGNKAKARKQLEELLEEGETIVVDDTNYNKEIRAEVIGLAKRYNPINITAVYMNVPKEICLERNKTRANKVPAIAIHSLAKKFEPPTLDEGFTDILIFDQNGKSKI